jgi:hypothetical protein
VVAYDTSFDSNNRIPHGYPNLGTIKKSITALYRSLSAQRIKSFSDSLPPGATDLTGNQQLIVGIQKLASTIARQLALPSREILVTFVDSLPNPGQVELSHDGYFIELHARYETAVADIRAILAHEITHVLLHRAGISFPDIQENEILTDTVAAYLGIGWPRLSECPQSPLPCLRL